MITMNVLQDMIENWAETKGILSKSSARAQVLKAVSEMGELCDAEVKDDCWGQMDAVGDVMVCLIIYCKMRGYTLEECLNYAWEEIKNRNGKMVDGGVFIKEEPTQTHEDLRARIEELEYELRECKAQ